MYIKNFKISVTTGNFKEVAELLDKVKSARIYELFDIKIDYVDGKVSVVTFESRYSGTQSKDKTFKLIRILTPYI